MSVNNNPEIQSQNIQPVPKQRYMNCCVIEFKGHRYSIDYEGERLTDEQFKKLATQTLRLIDQAKISTQVGDTVKISHNEIKHLSEDSETYIELNEKNKKNLQSIFKSHSQSLEEPKVHEDHFHPQITFHRQDISPPIKEVSKNNPFPMPNVSPASSQKANELLAIVDKAMDKLINVKEGFPFHQSVDLGDGTEVEITRDDFGKTVFKFNHEGKPVIVNEFAEGAYRGPQHADFRDRLELLHRSLEERLPGWAGDKEKPEFKGILKKFNDILKNLMLEAEMGLIQNERKNIDIDPTTKEGKKRFEKSAKEAEKILSQFIADAAALINHVLGGKKITVDDIKRAEIDYVTNSVRPTTINKYEIEFNKETKTFISMQQPRSQGSGGRITPSTNRKIAGLVNYVSTSHGVIEPNGKVRITYEGIRHSSYPPIAIEDKPTRQQITKENVIEGLRDLARDKGVNDGNSEGNPLEISLRTMVLLTAKIRVLDNFARNRSKGEWKGESEEMMLRESYQALMGLDGKTFPVKIDGVEVWIKPNIKVMNLGINMQATPKAKGLKGLFGKIPNATIHDEVNRKGFHEFVEETGEYVQKFVSGNKELSGKVSRLRGMLDLGLGGIKGKIKSMETDIKKAEEKLAESKKGLEGSKKSSKIDKATKLLKKSKIELKRLYRDLEIERKKNYAQMPLMYKNLSSEIVKGLEEMRKDNPEATKVIDLLQASTQAVGLYLTGEHLELDKITDFQSCFLIAHQLMGNATEFFCKSAEDRTGNQNNRVEEQMIHREFTGKLAFSGLEKKQVRESISSKVHMYSASQDNTFYNSYSRGLQISGGVNADYSELANAGKVIAGFAKSIFSKAKKKKPSPFAKNMIKLL